jgi:biotin transport system substrate-specific component
MRLPLRTLVIIPLMTALVAVLSLMPGIPFVPVPITLQTLGVMLAGIVLGSWRGALSMALYLLVGAVGAPVFAQGNAGLAVFAGPTLGFLVGFVVAAYLIGLLTERTRQLSVVKLFVYNLLFGVLLVNLVGALVMAPIVKISPVAAIIFCTRFLPGDVLKAIVAAIVGLAVVKALRQAGFRVGGARDLI